MIERIKLFLLLLFLLLLLLVPRYNSLNSATTTRKCNCTNRFAKAQLRSASRSTARSPLPKFSPPSFSIRYQSLFRVTDIGSDLFHHLFALEVETSLHVFVSPDFFFVTKRL
jgi:hypothetical protein